MDWLELHLNLQNEQLFQKYDQLLFVLQVDKLYLYLIQYYNEKGHECHYQIVHDKYVDSKNAINNLVAILI